MTLRLPVYVDYVPTPTAVELASPIDRDVYPPAGTGDKGRACDRCKLADRPGMRSPCLGAEGKPGGLLVIGEAPGQDEDSVGRPFIGKSGHLLRAAVKAHWGEQPVAYDNALRCFPARTVKLTDKMISACRGYLTQTIDEVRPTRIITVGAWAAMAVFGRAVSPFSNRKGYGYLNGEDIGGKPIPVFMVLHPSAALRNRFVRKWFDEDIVHALTSPDPPPGPWTAEATVVSNEKLARFAEQDLMRHRWVSFDVETRGTMWNDDFEIISVALCGSEDDEVWIWDHAAMLDEVLRAPLLRLLQNKRLRKMGQNVKYDQLAFRSKYGITVRPIFIDTRLQRKLLEPEADGALGKMAELVGMGGLKEEAQGFMKKIVSDVKAAFRKKTIEDQNKAIAKLKLPPAIEAQIRLGQPVENFMYGLLPYETLTRYNARDTLATKRLGLHMEAEIASVPQLKRMWDVQVLPAAQALERVEGWGVGVSKAAIRQFDTFLERREITCLATLAQYAPAGMNWGSPPQVCDLLFNKLRLKPTKLTGSGKPSTDADTLKALAESSDHPLPKALLDYRFVTKLRGTYSQGLVEHIRKDGRIHPNIKLDGARSGRTSCIAARCRVRTKRGDLPIADVVTGDMVWTHRERWRRVTLTIDQGRKPVIDLHLSNGNVLTCTSDHRLLGSAGWREASFYGRESGVDADGGGAVPLPCEPNHEADRGAAPDPRGTRIDRLAAALTGGGVQGAEGAEVRGEQDRQQEPDARKDGHGAPQLEGGVPGRQRVLHDPLEGEAPLRSPRRHDAGAGDTGDPGGHGGTSHRRRPVEQPAGQPRPDDAGRSQAHSLLAGAGQPLVTCTISAISGDQAVYDLSVEEDQSFFVEGIFAHNCTAPNLHNIPRADSDEGKMARDCFVAPKEFFLVEADYSQLELRVAAMLSGDKLMLEIFNSGVDYHLRTAQLISKIAWGIPPEAVEKKHRSLAKNVNFGVLYGKTAHTFSKEWGVSKAKAQLIVDSIMGQFKDLEKWCRAREAEAMRTGQIWTWWDGQPARRRPLWRIADQDDGVRSVATNGAKNTPIQGTASDYCIASLRECVQWIEGDNIEDLVKLILAVHDSLMFEVHHTMVNETINTVSAIMTSHNSNGVPLVADFKVGKSWGSMKEIHPGQDYEAVLADDET